jgi:DNA polymerase-3 subunit delta'
MKTGFPVCRKPVFLFCYRQNHFFLFCIFENKKTGMQFKEVIGQEAVKQRLIATVNEKRVAHTQLFLGPEGAGALPLALAFAQYVNCPNKQQGDSCGTCSSCVKYQKYAHPDLHFVFPTATTNKVKKNPQAELFQEEWADLLRETRAYVSQNAWYEKLGIGNKQGTIYARDANEIIKLLGYKPYEAQYKVVIIFQAERLHVSASNKLLKSLEEPPDNTLIILVAERYEMIIPTVRSRAQLVKIPRLPEKEIQQALMQKFQEELTPQKAAEVAALSHGNWNLALELKDHADENDYYFLKFREWMRLCFRGNDYVAIHALVQELSRLGREKQKRFLSYGLQVLHHSLFINEKQTDILTVGDAEKDYLLRFSPYVTRENLTQMYALLNEAIYHIERNAHPGILFADLSFRFTTLLQAGKKR